MNRENDKFMNLREYSRIDAHIPFEATVVPVEERKNLRSRISGQTVLSDFQTLPDLEDKLLNDWFRMLNAKLDTLLNLMTFQREGISSLPFTHVNISAGGISFISKQWYNRGDVLEMKMMLPMIPPVALYVYGEVVKVEKRVNVYNIGVKFIEMDEEIADEIVKFVFRKQREILRDKRK